MVGILLDTSVITDLGFLDWSWPEDDELMICSISLAELSAGPFAGRDAVERARRAKVLQAIADLFPAPLPFGAKEAQAYGLVWAATVGAGRKPRARFADLLIASVAIAQGLDLATRNPADFAHLVMSDLFALTLTPIN